MVPPRMVMTLNPQQQQSTARDLSNVDSSLSALQQAHSVWSADVQATDSALAALEAAQATYDAAKAQEANSRAEYELAQNQYGTDYAAVPKEDTLP